MVALQEDPEIVLQTEFDSNSLMGTLMNNLRDQKTEIKGRAITNEQYVPGGKSLLELDQEKVQRMQMGKALSSKGGRNWGSGSRSGGSPHKSQTQDDVFESVSLAEMESYEQEEEVPLSVLRERIITQRQDAEESLVDRMRRLKEEKSRKMMQENETLVERMARIKMEQNETLQERKNRLRRQNMGDYCGRRYVRGVLCINKQKFWPVRLGLSLPDLVLRTQVPNTTTCRLYVSGTLL
jgi:hypothetical protein